MALTPTNSIPLGFTAPDFTLVDPFNEKSISLSSHKGNKGTLVFFICNHCPYVIHMIDALVDVAREYQSKGIAFIAINSNDVEKYPADSPDEMANFSLLHRFPFPYVFDGDQSVAKAYDAACTPDFFLFDGDGNLFYTGQFDDTRPGKGTPDGKDLREAVELMVSGGSAPEKVYPSSGCNIKWKDGVKPSWWDSGNA